MTPKVHPTKEKRRIARDQFLKLLCFKGHHQKSEKTTLGTGKILQVICLIRVLYVDYIKIHTTREFFNCNG